MYKNINKKCEGIWEIQTSSLCPTVVQMWDRSGAWRSHPSGVIPMAGAGFFCSLQKAPCVPGGKRGACGNGVWSLENRLRQENMKTECFMHDSLLQMTHFLQKENCEGYKNRNWISLQKRSNARSLGEICVKTTVVYSSQAWVFFTEFVLQYSLYYNNNSYEIIKKPVAYFLVLSVLSLILVKIIYAWVLHHLLANELVSRCQRRLFCPTV